LWEKRISLLHRGPLLYRRKSLSWNIFFKVNFVTNVSLYFWNLHKNGHLLIPMKSILWNKILVLYIEHNPNIFDPLWSGHWVKTLFSFIFFTFERYILYNKPHGYFCLSSNINPPYYTVWFLSAHENWEQTDLQFWDRQWCRRINTI
jgi:hypothetical protein